ncbi:MAG: RNase adapter RapZ [Betaproteobacteria bacterium]|nr:RNase adapter RapZ [Betaproteobacteria bacterium]
MQLVLITGMSGSGKSVALNVLEDSGYYCVDNLPATLLTELADLLRNDGNERIAVSIDARGGKSFTQLLESLHALRQRQISVKALFLDAKTETLIKRFSETRRRHPLADEHHTLPECILAERQLLEDASSVAHHVDTSDLSSNALRAWVKDFVYLPTSGLTLLFESFGFKHGLPLGADYVFDVRCLPNPYYDPALRALTGKDQPVIDFLKADSQTQAMLMDIRTYIDRWFPCFVRDNRSYLTVAIGCTGGHHRSVYFSEMLAQHFRSRMPVLVRHRELAQ